MYEEEVTPVVKQALVAGIGVDVGEPRQPAENPAEKEFVLKIERVEDEPVQWETAGTEVQSFLCRTLQPFNPIFSDAGGIKIIFRPQTQDTLAKLRALMTPSALRHFFPPSLFAFKASVGGQQVFPVDLKHQDPNEVLCAAVSAGDVETIFSVLRVAPATAFKAALMQAIDEQDPAIVAVLLAALGPVEARAWALSQDVQQWLRQTKQDKTQSTFEDPVKVIHFFLEQATQFSANDSATKMQEARPEKQPTTNDKDTVSKASAQPNASSVATADGDGFLTKQVPIPVYPIDRNRRQFLGLQTPDNLAAALEATFSKPARQPLPLFQPPSNEEAKDVLLKKAREKYGIDTARKYNFAIAGCSGSGKSTLINVLRGLKPPPRGQPFPEGWAAERLREGSQKVTGYPIPGSSVVLWDMPGGDTDLQPGSTYFEDKLLYAFDAIIVVYHNRLLSSCTDIAEGCRDWGVPLAFVRNKADADIDEDENEKEEALEERIAAFKTAMDRYVAEQAGDIGRFAPKFLISARNVRKNLIQKFDMGKLLEFVLHCGLMRDDISHGNPNALPALVCPP